MAIKPVLYPCTRGIRLTEEQARKVDLNACLHGSTFAQEVRRLITVALAYEGEQVEPDDEAFDGAFYVEAEAEDIKEEGE